MLGVDVEADATDDIAGTFREELDTMLLEAADAGFERAQEKTPADTGQLLKSGVPPKMLDDGTIVWGYAAPHAPYLEFGTAPHWPPIQPLKDWARRVLGDESAAYAVQRKIAAEGTPPQPFVRPGIERMRRRLKGQDIPARISDNLQL